MSGEVEAGVANLTVEGAITLDGVASSNIGIGGIAGAFAKDTGTFKAPLAVINCISNVTVTVTGVTGEPRVGGFAGYAFNATVANCVNNGEVKFEGNNQTRAAGFIGQTNRTHFIGCVNNGNVTVDMGTAAKAGRAAGIASVVTRGGVKGDEATATYTIFENCINNGAISGKNGNNMWVAGIAADFYVNAGNWAGKDAKVKFINCVNTGAIKSETSNAGNYPHAGGIAGYTQNGYTDYEFIGCVNNAEISSIGGKEVRAGGIVGSVYAASAEYKFDQCIAIGELKSGCFSLKNKADALATSTANADAGTIIAAIQAIEALIKESTATIAGFDTSKGVPAPETTPEETTLPAPETTEPAQSEPTGDSFVIFAIVAIVSVIGVALVAKRREN